MTFDFRDFLTKVETKQRLHITVTPSKTEPLICPGEWASIICARPLWFPRARVKFVQAGPIVQPNLSLHMFIISYLTPLHYLTSLRWSKHNLWPQAIWQWNRLPGPSASRQSPSICQILYSFCFKLSIPKTALVNWLGQKHHKPQQCLETSVSGPQEGTIIIVQHSLISLMIPLRHIRHIYLETLFWVHMWANLSCQLQ